MREKQIRKDVLFYGIGGQGVLTASEICAVAAMIDGSHVKKTEVKGMSQRGGSVESYVRFSKEVFSPLPAEGKADIIVCLHEQEYDRLKDRVSPEGKDLIGYLKKAHDAIGQKKLFLNTYMLGVLSAFLNIKESSWLEALDRIFKKEKKLNKEFFLKGRQEGALNDI